MESLCSKSHLAYSVLIEHDLECESVSRCFQQGEGALLTELRCQLYLSRLGV